MIELWTQWRPIEGLATKYDIEEILSTKRGFTVLLSDMKNHDCTVEIYCKDWAEAYRCADETLRCRVIADLDARYGTTLYDWTLFTVEHSSYIQWLSEQSCTISDGMMLTHYSILAANMVLDIAAIAKPMVRIVTK